MEAQVSVRSSAGIRTSAVASAVASEEYCRPTLDLGLLETQPRQGNSTVGYDTLEDTVDSYCAPSSLSLVIDTVGDSLQESRTGQGGNKWNLAADGEDAGALVCSMPARRGSGAVGVGAEMGTTRAVAGSGGYPVENAEGAAGDGRTGVAVDG